MALWGNRDSKTATGLVQITSGGVVTGNGTTFTTEAKIGNYIRVSGVDYVITKITSDTAATVESGTNGGSITAVASDTAYTLSEKPVFVAQSESASSSGVHGDSTKVFGVNVTEIAAGGDNVVNVAVATAGTRYVEVPTVSFSGGGGSSAAATASISGGVVSAIAVTNVGSSYTSAPTVAITAPRITIATSAINTGTDVITFTAHGFTTADAVVYQDGGGTAATGLTDGTTYYVNVASANTFTLYDTAAHATAGGATGLIDISGTGNNAQYFEISGGTQATATATLGEGTVGGAAHAGWVRRTVGTGGRAGRVQYETLVAMGTTAGTSGDQADDIQFPDS